MVVRQIDDADEATIPLERFGKCTMIPGDSNYIAYRIGSFDGVYEAKSNYITVEVNETTAAKTSVPAGFLGYPIPQYNGTQISASTCAVDGCTNNHDASKVSFPTLKYNTYYDEDIKTASSISVCRLGLELM